MDANTARPDDELNELESRLSGWKPASAGLDADRMLFLAGHSAARGNGGRFLWPASVAALSLVAALLGAWAGVERAERLALVRQSKRMPTRHAPAPSVPADADDHDSSDRPAENSFLASHRLLENGIENWPISVTRVSPDAQAPSAPVLRAWPTNQVPDL